MIRSISLNNTLRRASAPVAVAAALLLVGGCGGGGQSAAPKASAAPTSAAAAAAGKVLEVTGAADGFTFAPAALTASAGETTIRFTNKGVTEHNFTIDDPKIAVTAAPGKTAEAKVTLKPGTYPFVCTVPGHLESGMKGTLTVS